MSTITQTAPSSITRKVRSIRNAWSPNERCRRALMGSQRRRELIRLLTSDRPFAPSVQLSYPTRTDLPESTSQSPSATNPMASDNYALHLVRDG